MRALLRAYDGLILALAVLGGAVLAASTLLIVADVTSRNLGLSPLRAASTLVEYAMLTATACGAPWLVRRGGHIAIDSFVRQLPPAAHAAVARLTIAFCAAVAGFLAWRALALALEVAARGDVDIRSIDVPGWVAPALLALALGLCAVEFVRLLATGERPAGGHGAGA